MDFQEFYRGKSFDAYAYLGAAVTPDGVVFRTFAPAAESIEVIGEWNNWEGQAMARVYDGNFWEACLPEARIGMMYKYRITGADGRTLDHCDPYGRMMEKRPGTASMIWDDTFEFADSDWLQKRSDGTNGPVNIYEMHFGSWKRKSDASDDWYSYAEMAETLIPYLKAQGYNYVEVLPLMEHPVDASWGYQNTGFYAPTSRYGTPEALKIFVDACHREHIGVIMDFVPVHFAVDDYALWHYDGTALYEYPHEDVGVSEWGSCNFMHSRPEVRSFLQSCADYWLSVFHLDGLRFDAVSNLIYWQGNASRGVNADAVAFMKKMNAGLKARHPAAMLIAEDSTNYPQVTDKVENGGLGFDYKWDMGWMHDTLSFFQTAPKDRPRDYHKLTFSMAYFYREHYLLPFSHDEGVHGKATIAQKMYGDYEEKFPQARTLYLYMMSHPGKKLNFMGGEWAQLREWDEKREQDWLLMDFPIHNAFRQYMADLSKLYLAHSALWAADYEESGFRWVDCHQEARCLYVFERFSKEETLLIALNLSDRPAQYPLPVKAKTRLKLLLSTDWACYGGSEDLDDDHPPRICEEQVILKLPPFSGKLYKWF
jgi:1,4-alpha-glucan branching enzyme